MTALPYRVECKSTYVFFELIAAFNIQSAAESYAEGCAADRPKFTYRVKKGKLLIRQWGPSE